MKRSTALKNMRLILDMNMVPKHQHEELAEALLFNLETLGMKPPTWWNSDGIMFGWEDELEDEA